jgi:hypothetical protein
MDLFFANQMRVERTKKMPQKFTKELLDQIIQRDDATLIGEYPHINRETHISFKCKCGGEFSKGMRALVENAGALCKTCTMKHMVITLSKTMTETYGVSHNSYNLDTIQKRKDTIFEHFGVAHHLQLPEKIEERRETTRKKFGVDHHLQRDDILAKQRQTNRDKRGVDNPMQSDEVKAKSVATNLITYGVEHPSQNQEVMERTQKNAKRFKEFVMPSGDIRKVQGYEPFALKKLLEVYTEDQLKTGVKNVPRIQYEVNGKKRYHFPDIFIPHENKLVEVKSTWTFKNKADNVLLKKKAAEEQGFLYEIWCFDGKGKRVEV